MEWRFTHLTCCDDQTEAAMAKAGFASTPMDEEGMPSFEEMNEFVDQFMFTIMDTDSDSTDDSDDDSDDDSS